MTMKYSKEHWMKFVEQLSRDNSKMEGTIKAHKEEIGYFYDWVTAVDEQFRDLTKVSGREMQDYRSWLLTIEYTDKKGDKQKYKPRTINKKIECLRSVFSMMQEEDMLFKNPMSKVKTIKDSTPAQPRWLLKNEKNAILRAVEDLRNWGVGEDVQLRNQLRAEAIAYLMLYAGLRVSEVASLTLKSIDTTKGTKHPIIHIVGKGERPRSIPLNKDCAESLKTYIKVCRPDIIDNDSIFISQKGTSMTKKAIHDLFNKIGKLANIDNLTPHVLRHTCAHDMVENGTPLQVIAHLLGHSDINTTRLYVTASQDEMIKAVNGLGEDRN